MKIQGLRIHSRSLHIIYGLFRVNHLESGGWHGGVTQELKIRRHDSHASWRNYSDEARFLIKSEVKIRVPAQHVREDVEDAFHKLMLKIKETEALECSDLAREK